MKNNEGRTTSPAGTLGPRAGRAARPLSATPARIVAMLREQPEPLSQAAIARATGLHPNTVREHLENLVRRGLLARTRAEPEGRGRPAWLYALTDADPEVPEYAGLAAALAGAIARTSTTPGADATAAGEEWGHDLARQRGASPTTPGQARERVVALLDDLGFETRPDPADPDRLRLTRCPLLQAAHRHPEVVCGVHLGIVRGALEELGADPAGSDLVPFAEPGACLLRLPPATPTADEPEDPHSRRRPR